MFGWNQISSLKDKAGSIGSKMKEYAKDMLVVEEGDPNLQNLKSSIIQNQNQQTESNSIQTNQSSTSPTRIQSNHQDLMSFDGVKIEADQTNQLEQSDNDRHNSEKRLVDQLNQTREERTYFKEINDTLMQEKFSLQEQLDKNIVLFEEEKKKLQIINENLNKDIDLYIDSIDKLEKEKEELVKQSEFVGETQSLKNTIENLKKQLQKSEQGTQDHQEIGAKQKYDLLLSDLKQMIMENREKIQLTEQFTNNSSVCSYIDQESNMELNKNNLNFNDQQESELIKDLEQQIKQLKEENDHLQQKCQQLQLVESQQFQIQNSRLEDVSAQLNRKLMIIEEMESKVNSNSNEQKQISLLTEQLQTSIIKIEELQKDIEHLTGQAQVIEPERQQIINDLNQQIASLQETSSDLNKQNIELQSAQLLIEKTVAEQAQILDSQLQEIAKLRSIDYERQKQIENLTISSSTAQIQFSHEKEQLQKQSQMDHDTQYTNIQSLQDEINQLQQQLQEAKNNTDMITTQLKQEIAQMTESKNDLESEITQLEDAFQFMQKSLKGKVDDQETFDQMLAQIADKEKEIKDQISLYKQSEKNIQHLEQQVRSLQEEKSQVENQILSLKKTNQEDRDSLTGIIQQTKQNESQANEQLSMLKITMNEMELKLQSSIQEQSRLEEEIKVLADHNNTAMLKIESYKTEQIKSDSEFQELKSIIESLENKLIQEGDAKQNLENWIGEFKIQTQNQQATLYELDVSKKQNESLLKENEILHQQLIEQQQYESDDTKQLEVIKKENLNLINDINDKDIHNSSLQNELILITKEREVQQANQDRNQISEDQYLSEIRMLKDQIQKFEQEQTQGQIIDDVQIEIAKKLEQTMNELDRVNKDVLDSNEKNKLNKQDLEQQLSVFKTTISDLEKQNQKLEKDLSSLKEINTYTEGLIVDYSSKIAPLLEENEQLQNIIKSNQIAHEKEKNLLKEQVSVMEQTNQENSVQKNENQSQIQQLKNDKQTLTNNIIKSLEQYTQEYAFQITSFQNKLNESRQFTSSIKYDDEFNGVLREFNKKKQIQSLLESLNQKTQVFLTLLSESIIEEISSQDKNSKASNKKNQENYQQMQDTYQKLLDSYNKLLEQQSQWQKKDNQAQQEISQNQKRFQDLVDKTNQIQSQLQLREQKFKEIEKVQSDLEKQKKEAIDEIQIKQKQYDELKSALKVKNIEGVQFVAQISQLTNDISKSQEIIKRLQLKEIELEKSKKVIEDKNYEVEQLNQGLSNIQMINEDLQQRLNFHEQKYESQIKNLNSELKSVQMEAQGLQLVKEKLTVNENNVTDQKNLLKKKDETIYRLQQEINSIKLDVGEQIQKLKSETTQNQNMIDRRVISKFLVNYFDTSTQYQTKLQILETLGCILSFTPEEMEKIGLHKYKLKQLDQKERLSSPKLQTLIQVPPPADSVSPQDNSKTLKQKFIGFLLDDE